MDFQGQDELLLTHLTSYRYFTPDKRSARTYPRNRKPVIFDNRVFMPTRSYLSHNQIFLADLSRRTEPRAYNRNAYGQRTRWAADDVEGCDLARSTTPLPSDQDRNQNHSPSPLHRQPILRRQEAFCDASTCKTPRKTSLRPTNTSSLAVSLEGLGALGSAISLNAIPHHEPLYSLKTAKRRRGTDLEPSYEIVKPLELHLSFAELKRDEAIARYLLPPATSETSLIDLDGGDTEGRHWQPSQYRPVRKFSPLRVIYEMVGAVATAPQHHPLPAALPGLVADIENDSVHSTDDEEFQSRAPGLCDHPVDSDLGYGGANIPDDNDWHVVDIHGDPDFDADFDVNICTTPRVAAGAWIILRSDS